MEGEVFINGKDIWIHYGAHLVDECYDRLDEHSSMKPYVVNASRTQHGDQVLIKNPRVASRKVILTFAIHGITTSDFRMKRKDLERVLTRGIVELKVIPLGTIYRLIANEDVNFNLKTTGVGRRNGKLTVRLYEPNPKNQESTLVTAYILVDDRGRSLIDSNGRFLVRNIK